MKLLLSEIVDDIGSRSTVADMCTAINEWCCEAPHFEAYVDLVLEGGLPGWYEYQYSTNATPLRDDRFITHSYDVLTKFLPPTAGTILFNGVDITHERPAQTARRGIVRSFQISAVFPHMTVLENVRAALQRQL